MTKPATTLGGSRNPPATTLPRRFQPVLTLGYHLDLLALGEDARRRDSAGAVRLVTEAVAVVDRRREALLRSGVPADDLRPTVAYLAALRLLRDLFSQGWRVDRDDDGLLLSPPEAVVDVAEDPSAAKAELRASFAFARRAQLASPSTARFVREMERRGVGRLIADGAELADRLRSAAVGGADGAVNPRIELIEGNARDPATGLRLIDVWRYMRLYWSIPHQSTPGRNLFYLVRDDAGPDCPVLGIAALGNAVLGLAQRDEVLGWTPDALRRRLERAPARKRRALLELLWTILQDAFSEILSDDLPLEQDRGEPVAVALRAVEQAATRDRDRALLDAGEGRTADYELIRAAHTVAAAGEEVDWARVARTDLYRRKRAGTLAELVEAEYTLGVWTGGRGAQGLLAALDDPDGRRAVETVLRRAKQRAIAENVMELITCGAVPPYGEVLGGKLVAMLMASPKVVRDFARRYDGRPSLIASGLAGRPLLRQARLTTLTTSSLYAFGSSQYNRIRIPGDACGGHGEVAFRRIGTTESFGTVHFAPDTAATLAEFARLSHQNRRLVNNLFGEGMSPKLRALRAGLESLGLAADVFLRHHSPRLLYTAALAHNSDEILLGLERRPKYVLGGSDGTQEIAAVWRSRWLARRMERPDVLQRLHDFDATAHLLGHDVPSEPPHGTHDPASAEPNLRDDQPHAVESPTRFVERLYRSTNSYADRLTPEQLEWIDVDLGLTDHLLELARASRQIVVTGNPGDGKTHLIERLRRPLEEAGAVVITDANVFTDEQLLATWQGCERDGTGLVLAINEWPLFALHQHPDGRDFDPLTEALRQVREAVWHLSPPEGPRAQVRVVDLSLRNLLAAPVVLAVVDRLREDRFYEGIDADDPALANRDALGDPLVRERLVAVLDRVARMGHHATMRQLVGFVAYLITAGRPAVERLAHQGSNAFHYATLCYEGGRGTLFDAVRVALDPANLTHPDHDLALWRGDTRPGGWTVGFPPSGGVQELPPDARDEAYVALKRRFFFEHEDGGDLLDLLPVDEESFERLSEEGAQGRATVVRDLILSINRFYEPDAEDNDRLALWQSHRYDVSPPVAFVSLREVPHEDFRVEPARLADWANSWLSREQYLPRAFAMVARGTGDVDVATLLVDRDLYLTLVEAHRGLGRAGWSRSATRRLTRFIDRLQRAQRDERTIADIRIRNVQTDLDAEFEVHRDPPRYRL